MTAKQSLSDQYDTLSKFKILINDIPTCITNNLNLDFPLRLYQKEALRRFIYYIDHLESSNQQTAWLLFQMATGSGKTLIMASQILYLYTKGYRNFIFFVNSANVIEKTRDNFLNKESKKYLFAKEVKFNERIVKINEVDEFQGANNDNINILFTTIQKLHSDFNRTIGFNHIPWRSASFFLYWLNNKAFSTRSFTPVSDCKMFTSFEYPSWRNSFKEYS